MKHLDLFSGIGGFALAARMVGGIDTKQFVEIDPYCQRVLAKNFLGVPIHGDITTFVAARGEYDLITGGFPCQDISAANSNGRGLEGQRSGLFYELMRIVCECRPRYVVLENVANLLRINKGRDMGAVLWELSQGGYDAEWQIISAASVGAPHLRERLFIVAYPRHLRGGRWAKSVPQEISTLANNCKNASYAQQSRLEGYRESPIAYQCSSKTQWTNKLAQGCCNDGGEFWDTEPSVGRVANGIPRRMDRLKGLGNAVVPQVAAIALRRVLQIASGGIGEMEGVH